MMTRSGWERVVPVLVCASVVCGQQTFYVDENAVGANNGSSWENAFVFLQDALAQAAGGDEIWVAVGTYRPDQGVGVSPLDRTASFELVEGVELYGGFSGGETSLEQRDVEANPTILSGDLNGDDSLVACNNDLPDCAATGERCLDGFCTLKEATGENSYTVVSADGVSAATVLDGFTITSGNANGPSSPAALLRDTAGAGMYIITREIDQEIIPSEPIVRNCRFEWNSSRGWGAGVYIEAEPIDPDGPTLTNSTFFRNTAYSPGNLPLGGGLCTADAHTTISDCTFLENAAIGGSSFGAFGGGIGTQYMSLQQVVPAPRITRCTFIDNFSDGLGGAMYDCHHNTQFKSCTFVGNRSTAGGAYANYGGAPTIVNSIFVGNSATEPGCQYGCTGGGLQLRINSQTLGATILNSLFVGNTAGLSGGGISWNPTDEPTADRRMTNTILWGNTANGVPDQIVIASPPGSEPKVTFCDIEGGWTNADCPIEFPDCNIDADPLFKDPAAGDFELESDSLCIDAGDNELVIALDIQTDFGGFARRIDLCETPDTGRGTPPVVDIGPHEAPETSQSCGACCTDDGCANRTGPDCAALGGLFAGVGNMCSGSDCNGTTIDDVCDIAAGASHDCNANEQPDECDIAQGSPDCNGNGYPDECDRDCNDDGIVDDCAAGCTDDCECHDRDACTYDECIDGACVSVPNEYGDLDRDGAVNVIDALCVLYLIAGLPADCSPDNSDIYPCSGDYVLNVFDVLAILGTIAGEDPCCGAGP